MTLFGNEKIRKPAVAGTFYPANDYRLNEMITSLLDKEKNNISNLPEGKIIGGIVPHAGYMYSGYEAVHFFNLLKISKQIFETIVIIHPNHSGIGSEITLDENEKWESPFGSVSLDKEFISYLPFQKSARVHESEHAGEVMLPFLQYFLDYHFRIVPVAMTVQSPENSRKLANAIFKAGKKLNKDILLIASSDFSHYIHPEAGKKYDKMVIDQIMRFDSNAVYKTVTENRITVCGYGPIMTLIEYAMLASGNPKAKILRTGNSGDISPSDSVVDYVCMAFYEI